MMANALGPAQLGCEARFGSFATPRGPVFSTAREVLRNAAWFLTPPRPSKFLAVPALENSIGSIIRARKKRSFFLCYVAPKKRNLARTMYLRKSPRSNNINHRFR